MGRVRAAALCLAILLAGCAAGPPASSVRSETGPDGRQVRFVIVGEDATLFEIARLHNVPIRGLVEVNGLKPPYRLRFGQRLLLPNVRSHTVRPGETLWRISRLYDLDVNALARENGLKPPYLIRVGDRLRLPDTAATVAALPPAATPPAAPPAVTAEPLAPSTPPAAADAPPLPRRKPLPATPSTSASPPAAAPAPAAPPPAAAPAPAPAPRVAMPKVPARAPGRFLWPTEGRLVSRFGPKEGGLHNDGINIAVPRGTPVRAAQNGVVVYTGNELRGFGNLVLLKHDGGWITAYAHNDSVLVQRGAVVARGQTIARAGSTGGVTTPQLHFEIRKDGRPVDPMRLLAPAS